VTITLQTWLALLVCADYLGDEVQGREAAGAISIEQIGRRQARELADLRH
jgi:hypothetical protein